MIESMLFKYKLIWVIVTLIVQQVTCYLSLDIFDFFYIYEDGIESGTFGIDDLPFSFKGIVLFILYFIFVFGILIVFNVMSLLFFWKLNDKFNTYKAIDLGYVVASFCIILSYLLAVFVWFLILAFHDFPEYFPDNIWRGMFLMLKPYYPGMLLFLFIGNALFYSFYVPVYIWILRRNKKV